MTKFQFSNVVVVDLDQIGVIVKSWADNTHDVYVRSRNGVWHYREDQIRHFIYSKELSDEEREYYK